MLSGNSFFPPTVLTKTLPDKQSTQSLSQGILHHLSCKKCWRDCSNPRKMLGTSAWLRLCSL